MIFRNARHTPAHDAAGPAARCVDAIGGGNPFRSRLLLCGAAIAAATLGLTAQRADAATAVSTMAVSSTVQATCTNTITPLDFGTYTGVAVAVNAIVTVTCTNTTPYNVGLDAGASAGATVTTRALTGTGAGAPLLDYVLTTDAANTINWGDTVGTDTVAGTGNGAAQALTIYGQEAAGQFVAPGTYADTITATVTY